MRTLIRMFALAVAACACVAPAAAQSYRCVVFPTYEGSVVGALRINNLNESVGTVTVGDAGLRDRAAIFRADGSVKYVHDVPSRGVDINDSGNAVFTLVTLETNIRGVGIAYYESSGNRAVPVPVPVGDPSSSVSAAGIDSANTIFGNFTLSGSDFGAPFMVRSGSVTDLSPALGGVAAINAVSSSGDVVGTRVVNGKFRAFRYSPPARRAVDLTRLLGRAADAFGNSINSSLSVGGVRALEASKAGFVIEGQTVTKLEFAGENAAVTALNEGDDAVGYRYSSAGGPTRVFHWRAGVVTDMTQVSQQSCVPSVEIRFASDINDQGAILGDGRVLLIPETRPN